MSKRKRIAALEAEVADLRARVEELEARPVVWSFPPTSGSGWFTSYPPVNFMSSAGSAA